MRIQTHFGGFAKRGRKSGKGILERFLKTTFINYKKNRSEEFFSISNQKLQILESYFSRKSLRSFQVFSVLLKYGSLESSSCDNKCFHVQKTDSDMIFRRHVPQIMQIYYTRADLPGTQIWKNSNILNHSFENQGREKRAPKSVFAILQILIELRPKNYIFFYYFEKVY